MYSRQTIQRMKKRVEAAGKAVWKRRSSTNDSAKAYEAQRASDELLLVWTTLNYVLGASECNPIERVHRNTQIQNSDLRYVLGLAERRVVSNGRERS